MKILRLTNEHKAEVVDVLAAAFHDYPVMRFVLKTHGEEYALQLRAILDFYTEARLAKDRPVLGVRVENLLVAVALLDETTLKPWEEMQSMLSRLKSVIGESAYSRLELYETESSRAEPTQPHHFLGMLGVLPNYQGQGYARALLNKVKEMSIEDPQSTGICLSTEDFSNVSFYERAGYEIISEMDIAGLHSWCMFLSTARSKADS